MANSKATRRKFYREKDRPRVLAMARDTRQEMWGRMAGRVAAPQFVRE